jgi:small subunit ribosomal protein S10
MHPYFAPLTHILETDYNTVLRSTASHIPTALIVLEMLQCIQDQIRIDSTCAPVTEAGRKYKSLEIELSSHESLLLDAFSTFAREASTKMGGLCPAPSTPPIQFERWTVLASPHVHKTARTQFERRTHTRLLQVSNLHPELVSKLVWYLRQHSPPDVMVDYRLHSYLPLS